MRQDPDAILIGEIRDLETAKIATEAALTGHIVFATLHTNSAPQAITRLIEIGVEPYMVAPSVIGVLAQRLAARICENCKEAYTPTREVLAKYFKEEGLTDVKFYRGKGCPKCRGTGYKGRVAIHELVLITEEIRALISEEPERPGDHARGGQGGLQAPAVRRAEEGPPGPHDHRRDRAEHVVRVGDLARSPARIPRQPDPTPPCQTRTIIDPEAIATLKELNPGDNGAFLKEIVGIYLEDTPQAAPGAEGRALRPGDVALFTRAAHTIKGSSANVGAVALAGVAERLEAAVPEGGTGRRGRAGRRVRGGSSRGRRRSFAPDGSRVRRGAYR